VELILVRIVQVEAPQMSKKEKAKLAKLEKKNEAKKMAALQLNAEEEDPLAGSYGDVVMENLQSKEKSGRAWSKVGDLDGDHAGQTVLVRGRVHTVRGKGSLGFLVVREAGHTVQCVVAVKENVVSKGMIKFVTKLNKESIVDVEGVVIVPPKPVEGTSQPVCSGHRILILILVLPPSQSYCPTCLLGIALSQFH
jgi:aspartyl-tRNA synthetase